jgi:hypothetical protein
VKSHLGTPLALAALRSVLLEMVAFLATVLRHLQMLPPVLKLVKSCTP